MIIDMAVLGAIGLAGGALSTGNHIFNNRRIKKIEKSNKIRTVEVSVLEATTAVSLIMQLIDRRENKKSMEALKLNQQTILASYESRINALNARIDAMRIDDVAMQNEIINAKVDHVANVVDIAVMDDE